MKKSKQMERKVVIRPADLGAFIIISKYTDKQNTWKTISLTMEILIM